MWKSRGLVERMSRDYFLCIVAHWAHPTKEEHACTKSLRSCLTLCNAMDCSLPGSSVLVLLRPEYWIGLLWPSPGDLPDPGTELASLNLLHWLVGSLPLVSSGKRKWLLSCVQLFATLRTAAHQAPLSMPFPSPGAIFNPGIEPGSTLQVDSLPSEPPG